MDKKIGRVTAKANRLFKNIFNTKKKKILIAKFIISITTKFIGGNIKAKVTIKNKSKSKKAAFFQYFPVASIINFNYNEKL